MDHEELLSEGEIEHLYMTYCPDDSLEAAISFARAIERHVLEEAVRIGYYVPAS